MKILPVRQKKINSDFPERKQTEGFVYKNRIGDVVRADGWNNLFGVFRKGTRIKTIDYDTAKSEYDYELSLKIK